MDEKEEGRLKRRFLELANTAYQRMIPVFSDFLTLYEQDVFLHMTRELPPVNYKLIGGCPYVERALIAFIPMEWEYEPDIPIDIIRIAPVNSRFSDSFSHRDILGALMNLGIERSVLGDILLDGNTAYVITLRKMQAYICRELSRIKHTTVACTVVTAADVTWHPAFQEITGSVSSVRPDSVSALAFHRSRTVIQAAIQEGRLFVNGRLITTNACHLREGDRISIRGLGKYEFLGAAGVSKKGKTIVKINLYT